ncbi:MAG: aminotransferase class V-fold PLP-dependent enzyme [candidate division NC10 bacterium]|nr:aminotransferase class V-fold PLP-dependent enzyme [candidate division NC10 bacterium]
MKSCFDIVRDTSGRHARRADNEGTPVNDASKPSARQISHPGPRETADFASIQTLFPIKKTRCYLNNASIGPLCLPVIAAIDSFLADVRDNGRNNYPAWCTVADTEVKERLARLIGAQKSEIAFVKNTTEGLVTVANGLPWRAGDNVIIADIEYPSNVYCWMKLKSRGVELRWARNRNGRIRVDDIAALMDNRTRLVSLSAVQFSNGYRQDLALTGDLCRSRGVLLNLDAIQWVGALHMDVSRYPVDFLSAGGHKWILGPIGTGFFYCRAAAMDLLDPPNVGYHSVGKHEDHMDYELVYRPDAGRFEEALVNFPGIWGLDAAVQNLLTLGTREIEKRIRLLTDLAMDGLLKRGYEIVSPQGDGERSGILSFRHPSIPADDIAPRLAEASVDLAVRGGALRISPSFYNDEDEIERFLDALPKS